MTNDRFMNADRSDFPSSRVRVELDQCPRCGGIWLDTDELASIRRAAIPER